MTEDSQALSDRVERYPGCLGDCGDNGIYCCDGGWDTRAERPDPAKIDALVDYAIAGGLELHHEGDAMGVIAHDEYKIDVCSVCGERVLAVGYLCNHIPMHEAESIVIEVVPKQRLVGAVDREREALRMILKADQASDWDRAIPTLAQWAEARLREIGGQ